MLSGEAVGAERALALGLVQKILPVDRWSELDELWNGHSAPVLRITKRALALGSDDDRTARLEALKQHFLSELYRLEDVAEGITSFVERRRPQWKHR